MADKVEVQVSPTTFTIAAGGTTEVTATLRNLGQTVDQFTLSIDGLDQSWYALPVSSVALFPNDQDKLRIIFNPPKTAKTKGGSYPFHINAASQENPDEIATVALTLEIQTIPGLEVDISPQRIVGRNGFYKITVSNKSDSETAVLLKASDAERKLWYHLHPMRLTVPGGGHTEATLEVKLGWLDSFGGEKEFDFQVEAAAPEGKFAEEAKSINGQLVRITWYKNLPKIRFPWLEQPPAIRIFEATTEDKREFTLSWVVKRATKVKLDDEDVDRKGERLIHPTDPISYVLTASNKYGSLSQTIEVKPKPLPKAKLSERIRASLTPTQFQVHAGGAPVQATLQVQNLGDTVDKFLVEIKGLEGTWYSRSASSIALMPQAKDQVQISFNPPKRKGVKSIVYHFAVTARSQSSPEEATTVVAQLEVLPLVEFKLAVRPYRISCRRKGTYKISLANTGVTDTTFYLKATDLEEGVKFRFKNETPKVPAWETLEVPMVAKPNRGSVIGDRKRYDISITAAPAGGNTQSVNAELNHRPFISSWRPILRLIRFLIILGLLIAVVYYVIQLGGGWEVLTSSPQVWFHNLVLKVEGLFRFLQPPRY